MAHGTNHPLLIIIITIHIIIFLFYTASANLIVYFPLIPMGICFYITGQLFHVLNIAHLWVTATSFFISTHIDDRKAIWMCAKQPVKEHLLHYQLSKPS